jgi:hypothetical protein
MREVRVESLDGLETAGGEVRLSTNSGGLRIVFPKGIWESLFAAVPAPEEPTPQEIEALRDLRRELEAHAREHGFSTVLEGVQCGDGLEYDLVLRPASLYAATTGYHFAPVVGADLMARFAAGLEDDRFVEQAYVIGAVAEPDALAAGDENLRALSVRGRRCGASRFEMAPELWQVLSERLGWDDVKTPATEKGY